MDKVEEVIITKLLDGPARSTDILNAVREKTGIQSRETYQARLRNLKKIKLIKYKNRLYFLAAPSYRRHYLKAVSQKLRVIEKKVDSLPEQSNTFLEGYKLLKKIFNRYYFSLGFDLACRENSLTLYEQRKMNDMKNWCKKMIKSVVMTMQDRDKSTADSVLRYLEIKLKI